MDSAFVRKRWSSAFVMRFADSILLLWTAASLLGSATATLMSVKADK